MNFDLLSYLLKASLVMAILTGAYAWLVKRETFLQVNRWLLWINVAATLILPIVPVPDWKWVPDTPAQIVNQAASWSKEKAPKQLLPNVQKSPRVAAPTYKEENQSKVTNPAAPPQKTWTLFSWIALVYWLGAGLLGAKFLLQLASLWRLKQKSTLYATDYNVVLVENPTLTAPFSFFHWIFYNPHQHTTDEWEQVWTHECIHAQQYHSLDMLSSELLKCLFWFNPFAWWHQRLVQETLEYITDRAVLDTGVEKKSYQFHLLRSTLSTSQQTFANHFNQSLLKNRIAMMNKRKSNWKAFGKYGLFIASIWVCAAFTKPYRAKVSAQIAEKVPELKLVLRPEIAKTPALNDFVLEKPLNQLLKDSVQIAAETPMIAKADTQKLISSTKYVIYEGKTLHWVITPKTTLEDFFAMKQEFKKHNLVLEIREMKMDPKQSFLQRIAVISIRPNSSSCEWDEGDNIIKPLTSHGGYITIVPGGCGTTDKKNMHPILKSISEQDEKIANEDFYKNRIEYLIIETDSKIGGGGRSMRRETLEYYKGKNSGLLNLNENDFLQVAEPHRKDIILLNGKPSTFEEVEKIALKDFHSAIFKETWEKDKNQHKNYILIFTE